MVTRQEQLKEGRRILKATTPERVYSLNDLSPKNYLNINYTYWLLNALRPFDCVESKYYKLILSPILADYENYDNSHGDSDSLKRIIEESGYEEKIKINEDKAYSWSQLSFLLADLYIYLSKESLNRLGLKDEIQKQTITKVRQEVFRRNAPERFKLICDIYNKNLSQGEFSGNFFNWFCSKLQESITNGNASEDTNTNDQENKKNNYNFICSHLVTAQNAPKWEKWPDLREHVTENEGINIPEITMFLKTQMGIHYEIEHIELLLRDAKLIFRAEHLNLIDRELVVWESLFDQINNALDAAQFEHNSFIKKVNLDAIKLEKTFGAKLKSAAIKVGIKLGVGAIYAAIKKITKPASSAIEEVKNTVIDTAKTVGKKVIGEGGTKIVEDVISDPETVKDVKELVSGSLNLDDVKTIFSEKGLSNFFIKQVVKSGIDIPEEYKISEEAIDQLKGIENSIGLRSFLNKRLSVLRQASVDVVDVTPDVDFQFILDYVYYQTLMGFKVGLGTYEDEEVNEGKYHQSGELLQQQDVVKTKLGKTQQVKDETKDENTDKFIKLEGTQLVRKARNMLEKSFEQQFSDTLQKIAVDPKYKSYLSGEGFMSLRRRIELQLWAEWIENFVDTLRNELIKNTSKKSYYQKLKSWIKGHVMKPSKSRSIDNVDEFITNYQQTSQLRDSLIEYEQITDQQYPDRDRKELKEKIAPNSSSDPYTSTMVQMLCKMEIEERDSFLNQQRVVLEEAKQKDSKVNLKQIMSENLSIYLSVKLTLEGSVTGFQVSNFLKVANRMVELAGEEKEYIQKSYKDEISEKKEDSTAYLYHRWLTEHKPDNLTLNKFLNIDNLGSKKQLYDYLYKNNYFKYSPFLDLKTSFAGLPENEQFVPEEDEQEKMKAKERDFLLIDR